MNTKKFHLVVIGAGSGGLMVAAGAAGLGARVALIEKNKMGGDCLNSGCVPSKAILHAAKTAYQINNAPSLGIQTQNTDIDFKQVMASVRQAQKTIEPHDSIERFTGLGVEVFQGTGEIIGPHEVQVNLTDKTKVLKTKNIVLSTGSSAFITPIPGLDSINPLTNENVWDLKELPQKLVVLGAGPIGCELAQAFKRLGSQVTLIEMMNHILPREDEEAAQVLTQQFKKEGIQVLTQHKALAVKTDGTQKTLIVQTPDQKEMKIAFDQILVSVGRQPNIQNLGLEKIGVKTGRNGIAVNQKMQSSVKNIYACGDVCGPYLFTHVAGYQAKIIIQNTLFPLKAKANYRVVPWCTYTDPEVAHVGLSEKSAHKQNIPYVTHQFKLSENDRAITEDHHTGFIKLMTAPGKDEILGATFVGPHAGEILHEVVLAMQNKIGLKKIYSMIHAYPTWAMGIQQAAGEYMKSKLTHRVKNFLKSILNGL